MTDAKPCRKCGPERGPLPISAYWRCAESRDGYRSVCKACAKMLWPKKKIKVTKGKVAGDERLLLFSLHEQGLSHTQIAKRLGRSRQTIAGIIYRSDPDKKPKPRAHPKSAVPKSDDDHPSKQSWGKVKPGDPLWPVEAARQRDARAIKIRDEQLERQRAEWLSYRT